VAEQIAEPTADGEFKVNVKGVEEWMGDKGYNSGAGKSGHMTSLTSEHACRTETILRASSNRACRTFSRSCTQ